MSGRDVTAGASPAFVGQPRVTAAGALSHQVAMNHTAVLYQDRADLDEVTEFAHRAADTGDALHVAAPDQTLRLIRDSWNRAPENSLFVDMAELGRNPARIIAAGQSFRDEHPGQSVSCLWEPAWPSRSAAELAEVAKHESLCNLAFPAGTMTILCLYDLSRLSDEVLRNAALTHPLLISGGQQQISSTYLGAGRLPAVCDRPLAPPPAGAASVRFGHDLAKVRELAASQGQAAGLTRARVTDLVLAVSEVAANSLGHARDGGVLRSWCTSDEVVLQVEDAGHISDPLAGRCRQPADAPGGHGLWLVNQLSDLVEQRTGRAGTVSRLHMRRAKPA